MGGINNFQYGWFIIVLAPYYHLIFDESFKA